MFHDFHGKIMENPMGFRWRFSLAIHWSNNSGIDFAMAIAGPRGPWGPRLWRCSATISISRSMQRRCDEWRVVLLLFQLPTLCRRKAHGGWCGWPASCGQKRSTKNCKAFSLPRIQLAGTGWCLLVFHLFQSKPPSPSPWSFIKLVWTTGPKACADVKLWTVSTHQTCPFLSVWIHDIVEIIGIQSLQICSHLTEMVPPYIQRDPLQAIMSQAALRQQLLQLTQARPLAISARVGCGYHRYHPEIFVAIPLSLLGDVLKSDISLQLFMAYTCT